MNAGHDHPREDHGFDARLRQLHGQAVDHVSPRLLLQLRPQRGAARAPAKPRLHAWPLAATCAIALVAGGLFLRHPSWQATPTSPTQTAPVFITTDSDPDGVYAALDESPELYLWLASNDTANLVTE